MGAVEAWDYNDPDVVEKIKTYTGGKVRLVWDTIGTEDTVKICDSVISEGGKFSTISGTGSTKEGIEATRTIGYVAFGEALDKPFLKLDAASTQPSYEWAKNWISVVEPLLAAGKIKPHPTMVVGGLEEVLNGMQLMKAGKLSATKLVFKVD
jgi:NADPH:quinone reductase-like Zn-dependent oxidoreductase